MSLLMLKALHISCAAISYALFVTRGVWRLKNSVRLQRRWVKIVPHLVDTVLLASAISMAIMLGISPLAAPWLLAKIVALLAYIVLGTIAIKRGKTSRIRLSAWIAAQLVFGYIVVTAITHDPIPWHIFDR
jgi:uncharacterized membrane protein SirB2